MSNPLYVPNIYCSAAIVLFFVPVCTNLPQYCRYTLLIKRRTDIHKSLPQKISSQGAFKIKAHLLHMSSASAQYQLYWIVNRCILYILLLQWTHFNPMSSCLINTICKDIALVLWQLKPTSRLYVKCSSEWHLLIYFNPFLHVTHPSQTSTHSSA